MISTKLSVSPSFLLLLVCSYSSLQVVLWPLGLCVCVCVSARGDVVVVVVVCEAVPILAGGGLFLLEKQQTILLDPARFGCSSAKGFLLV